jgi:hypothetical protein
MKINRDETKAVSCTRTGMRDPLRCYFVGKEP